jgi:hypothetical protein
LVTSLVFALALASTAGQTVSLPELLPERPPPAASSATMGYFAESPWEFGAEGSPSADATTFDSSLSAALAPEGGFAAPANAGCALCCAGANACDQICLGGLFGRSIRNTIYFAFVGGAIGCFGGVLLGLIPAFAIAAIAGAFISNVGGIIAATILGFGGLGCLAGGVAGAPLGFYAAVLFPWWNPGGDGAQQTTIIIDGDDGDPPPRARRRRERPRDNKPAPKVEHREERKTERGDRGRRSRSDDKTSRRSRRSRDKKKDKDDEDSDDRRRRSPRR